MQLLLLVWEEFAMRPIEEAVRNNNRPSRLVNNRVIATRKIKTMILM